MNAGNYIIGIMFGFLFIEAKERLKSIRRSWSLEFLWHFCWIAGYIISMLGFPFIESNIEPSILTALYGGFMKHYHGLLMGVLTFGLILRFGWFVPLVFNMPFFRVLGRISYSYFLCHIFVMRIFMTGSNQLFEVSMSNVWALTAAIFFFGNLLAIPLALIVEFPINVIAKEFLKQRVSDENILGKNGISYDNSVIVKV